MYINISMINLSNGIIYYIIKLYIYIFKFWKLKKKNFFKIFKKKKKSLLYVIHILN